MKYPWPNDKTGLVVALDSETSGLFVDEGHRISTVSLAWWGDDGEPVTIALPFNQGLRGASKQPALGLYEDPNLSEDVWEALLDWLEKQWLVFHNAKFDLPMFRVGIDGWSGRDLQNRLLWDTMIAASVIQPREFFGLKPISERLSLTSGDERFHEQRVKEWMVSSRKILKKIGAYTTKDAKDKNPRYDLMPWEIMEGYAKQDTRLTLLLHRWQLNWLDEDDADIHGHERRGSVGVGPITARSVIDRRLATMRALHDMEQHGVAWNFKTAEKAAAACEKAVRKLDGELVELGVRKLTSFGLLKWLEDNQAWAGDANTGARYTPGGARSLDGQEVDRLLGYWSGATTPVGQSIFRVLQIWKERHEYDLAGNMWFRGYTQKMGMDGRIRTSYRQLKTVSGRMSVERINLQALPRDGMEIPEVGFIKVKQIIEPAAGYRLWNLDVSQAELRVGARLAKCVKMLELIDNNQDLHGYTARALFGGKLIERFSIIANVKSGTKCPRGADDASNDAELAVWKIGRQVGKTCNFSLLFRGAAKALMRALGAQARIYIPEHEASTWVEGWRTQWKEIPKAWYRDQKFAEQRGWVMVGGGPVEERSWLWGGPDRRFTEDYQAYNRRVQGGIALFNQEWLGQAGVLLRENPHAGRLVLNVHDSLVLEIADKAKPGKEAPKIVEHLARLGENLGREMFDTKIVIDINAW